MTSGSYILSSDSGMNTYGYLYKDYFNPLNPTENLLSENDENCGNNQFKFVGDLQSTATYILVTTTYFSDETGKFVIIASGPNNVTFDLIREY